MSLHLLVLHLTHNRHAISRDLVRVSRVLQQLVQRLFNRNIFQLQCFRCHFINLRVLKHEIHTALLTQLVNNLPDRSVFFIYRNFLSYRLTRSP